MFTVPLFIIAETWKQPECPSAEDWIKTWHQRYGILLSHSKERNNATCAATRTQLEMITLSELRKKKKYHHMTSLICRI